MSLGESEEHLWRMAESELRGTLPDTELPDRILVPCSDVVTSTAELWDVIDRGMVLYIGDDRKDRAIEFFGRVVRDHALLEQLVYVGIGEDNEQFLSLEFRELTS
jgi:hypothetical protein